MSAHKNIGASVLTKMQQWKAFLSKNKLQAPPLHELVSELRLLLWGKNVQ